MSCLGVFNLTGADFWRWAWQISGAFCARELEGNRSTQGLNAEQENRSGAPIADDRGVVLCVFSRDERRRPSPGFAAALTMCETVVITVNWFCDSRQVPPTSSMRFSLLTLDFAAEYFLCPGPLRNTRPFGSGSRSSIQVWLLATVDLPLCFLSLRVTLR